MEMVTTKFYDDFLLYYDKARILQYRNENKFDLKPHEIKELTDAIDDPLMQNIHIYDCVHRRQAGFSNALEDIHGKRSPIQNAKLPVFSKRDNKLITRFIHLFHRFTGSGASFESDHGYRNSKVNQLCKLAHNTKTNESAFIRMKAFIVDCNEPMVTSIGNQPPSLKNRDKARYRLAMQYYFDNFAEEFILDYTKFLDHSYEPVGIKEAVDFCCKWHKDRGFKQWHFVLTAFVMDDAEYYPEDVDPNSHCYYGANCIRAFKLMFEKPKGKRIKNAEFYEMCMQHLCDSVGWYTKPYEMEDVCCDMIRYWTEYKPKKDYDHLSDEQCKNNSILKVNGEYPEDIKRRIIEVCG